MAFAFCLFVFYRRQLDDWPDIFNSGKNTDAGYTDVYVFLFAIHYAFRICFSVLRNACLGAASWQSPSNDSLPPDSQRNYAKRQSVSEFFLACLLPSGLPRSNYYHRPSPLTKNS